MQRSFDSTSDPHPAGAFDGRERLKIRLFGPLAIEDGACFLGAGDLGGSRPKQVLQILIAARGHRVPNDRLSDLLWGEDPPQNAAGSLQTFISVLRRQLTPDRARARALVITEAEAYRFGSDLVELDLDRFDELLDRAAREPTRLARRSLDQALALVRGEVLEDEPYAVWAEELRRTYQGRVLSAHLDAADAALAELDYAAALAHAQAVTAVDRFDERAHRAQMLALYSLGRQHDALDTYRRFRARLDDELGLQPTAATRALESAILRQDDVHPLLPRPVVHERLDICAGSLSLLGRTDELATLERAARQALDGAQALLMLEGEAGLGKSRLLDELANSLAGIRVGSAGCSELEQHLRYVPLAAALRSALRETEFDSRIPALSGVLPEFGTDGPAREFAEIEVLEALVDLISSHAPLVLLIDDLQWADAATIAALSYLHRRCLGMPVAIVVALRGEQAPPDHPLRRLRPDTRVRLAPLTVADLAPLGIPELHDATGGNPRFIAERIATGDPVPTGTLVETVRAQCRAEGAWSYRLLLAASVLEPPFDPAALAGLLRFDESELVEELERLCERRILRVDGHGFRFRYALVREVLLASVSPARARLVREQLERPDDLASARSRGLAADARRMPPTVRAAV